jgi:hypothetical protein
LQGFSLKNRKTCEITNRVIEQVQFRIVHIHTGVKG